MVFLVDLLIGQTQVSVRYEFRNPFVRSKTRTIFRFFNLAVDASRTIKWEIKGLYGTYVNTLYTSLQFLVNSLGTSGHACTIFLICFLIPLVAALVRYDFNGDGVFDRSEVFKAFDDDSSTNFLDVCNKWKYCRFPSMECNWNRYQYPICKW